VGLLTPSASPDTQSRGILHDKHIWRRVSVAVDFLSFPLVDTIRFSLSRIERYRYHRQIGANAILTVCGHTDAKIRIQGGSGSLHGPATKVVSGCCFCFSFTRSSIQNS
jgi:hypothetical protein